MSLALSIPVLGLGLEHSCPWPWPRIFLCPWTWPRALCPRLHLWINAPMINRGGVEDTRLEAKSKDTKKSEAKDSLSEDRHSRGQGQECSRPRPRTQAQVLSKKKKERSSQKFFRRSPQKNVFQKIFKALHKILTIQKILLSSSRGQANFRGLEASRPRPRT